MSKNNKLDRRCNIYSIDRAHTLTTDCHFKYRIKFWNNTITVGSAEVASRLHPLNLETNELRIRNENW